MSMINYASREINCKLVYYGPGLGGKTTNLEHVYNKVAPGSRGKMISLATETERTLFFDFLPVDLGNIHVLGEALHPAEAALPLALVALVVAALAVGARERHGDSDVGCHTRVLGVGLIGVPARSRARHAVRGGTRG